MKLENRERVSLRAGEVLDDPERFGRCLKLRHGVRLFPWGKSDEADD